MPHDELLALRIRDMLSERKDIKEKNMFGGVAFLLNGNMSVGVHKDHLVVRVGPDKYDEALKKPYVKEFNITGRSMKGWVMIDSDALESEELLKEWINNGIEFAGSLPSK